MKRLLKISLCVFIILAASVALNAAPVNFAIGAYGGIAPSLGGDLQSLLQYDVFGSSNGIDGMRRTLDGSDTTGMDRLLGVSGGILIKMLFMEYYQIRLGANYSRGIAGGEGTSVYDNGGTDTPVDCEYSFLMYDVPLSFGISIPFWKDLKVIFSCGIAYARAEYKNRFETAGGVAKGEFTGWGLPLVILLEGEYFLNNSIAVSSSISYYRGSSKLLRDSERGDSYTDYARLNFNGYRYYAGITYYFNPI